MKNIVTDFQPRFVKTNSKFTWF